MMRKENIILLLIAIIGIAVGSYSLWKTTVLENNTEKTAYVNLKILFEDFEMKKELAFSLKKDLSQKQNELDSLLFELKGLDNKLNNIKNNNKEELIKFQQMQNYYVQQKNAFDQYQYSKTQQFDSQIIEQMTQYIKDFGNDSDYEYIYGLNSNGNIMYAREHKDITKEVLQFINGKYQGKN